MRKYVLYKIFTGSLFSLFSVIPATVSAENEFYSNGWNNAKPSMEAPVNSEATNPWHLSDEQKRTSKFWSPTKQQARQYQQQDMRRSDNQVPYYQSQGGTVPYRQVPDKQVWNQGQVENSTHERYVTQDVIDLLNRQEAHHYSRLNNEEEQYYRNPQAPSPRGRYNQYSQGYSASPSYGMGSVNPAYDVPAVSPWGETPDVMNGGEEFPWMPNEAIGGVPPIYVPPFVGNSRPDNVDRPTGGMGNEVFNPFTFLQNEN